MEKLTVLCVPISGTGHINPMLGLAVGIRNRGHAVVFAAERLFEGKFKGLGFDEEVYDETPSKQKTDQFDDLASQLFPPPNTKEEQKKVADYFFNKAFERTKFSNDEMMRIIQKWKPNVIIEDRFFEMPALINSGIPLIKILSSQAIYAFNDDRLPPRCFGLPLNPDHLNEWRKMRQEIIEMQTPNIQRLNDWLETMDPSIPKRDPNDDYRSTNLNIFILPKEAVAHYLRLAPRDDTWMGLDYSFEKPGASKFEVPAKLKNRPGKLIYFSLGTLGDTLIDLIKRLINILSKSKHNFIVSTGRFGDKIELSDNMWGDKFLSQLDILPHVDLVITHGGSNTFNEALYFGKPMIALPLFADQYDSAQLVVEMKIGHRFNPAKVTEEELNNAIEGLLEDKNAYEICQRIAKHMQESDSMDRVVDRIEHIAKHPKFPTITGLGQDGKPIKAVEK